MALIDGETMTIGNVVHTWNATEKAWEVSAADDPGSTFYVQDVATPALRVETPSEEE